MKKLLLNLLMTFVSVSLCLGAGELALRLFWPQVINLNVKHDLREADAELGAVSKPNLRSRMEVRNAFDAGLTTNSDRLRGSREYNAAREAGRTRILFLGDSFVFGWGLEDDQTWPARLEEKLGAAGVPAEVLNAGIYAFDTGHYLRWHRRLTRFKPDVVLVGFCLENDFDLALDGVSARPADAASSGISAPADDGPFVSTPVYQWVKQRVLLRSHLLAFFRDRLYLLFPDIRKYLFYLGVTDKREIFLSEYSERLRARLAVVERNLRQLRDEAEANGSKVAVIAIPLREQIYSPEAINHFKGFDVEKPNRALAEICEKAGLPFLDLMPEFRRRAARGERLYYETDPHWNPKGADAAAELTAEFFRKWKR